MAEYSLDQLLELKRLLSKYVGEDVASRWVQERFNDNVQYGLPSVVENGKQRNTRYGTLKNLDVMPWRYMPPESSSVTVVPEKEWNSDAYGTYSVLAGIRIPDKRYSHRPSENVLVHEGVHAREMFSPANPLNTRKEDSGLLQDVAKKMLDVKGAGSSAFTGRQMVGEVIPELVDYESRLPAWKKLQSTEFFKSLPSNIQAMIMRRIFPMPNGVDAMVGQGYD